MPFNGVFKFVHSVTTGVKNFAQGDDDYSNNRFRYPRYFDEQEVMLPYNTTMSLAFSSLNTANNGELKDKNILKAFDVSGYVDNKSVRFKCKVLIFSDDEVIFIQSLNKIKLCLSYKEIADVVLKIAEN